MTDPEAVDPDAHARRDILKTQALIITCGPLVGRICENDDDDFVLRSDLDDDELAWFEEAGVQWRKLDLDGLEPEDIDELEGELGVDCEVVTFGFYLSCPEHYLIPRQFLRPATMKDLIQRHSEIDDLVFKSAFSIHVGGDFEASDLNEILLEQIYITDEIWRRESLAKRPSEKRSVFLCHATKDKPFVRHVRGDLANAGHSVWMDEFEIKVGESIVSKIDKATTEADALILFVSKAAMTSDWVRREWSSTLSRSLSGGSTKILPILIEDCDVPALLSDIKYADFRSSYNFGLEQLLRALSALQPQRKSR